MPINIGAGQIARAVSTNFQDAPLGRVGNLAFAGKDGATPRAPSPTIFQRMGAKIDAAIAYVKASPPERASQQVVSSARKLSADTGALLGTLTAAPGDRGAQSKAASALASLLQDVAPLAVAGRSTPDKLIAPALTRHLDQLDTMDLVALRGGPLADPASRQAVLDQLDPGQRPAAEKLLDQIAGGLDKQIGLRASATPIANIAGNLEAAAAPGGAIDAQGMDAALEQLRAGAGMLKGEGQTLRHFFAPAMARMTDAELGKLASGLSQSTPAGGPSAFDALREGTVNRGPNGVVAGGRKEALDALQGAAADEISKRLNSAVLVASTSLEVTLRNSAVPVRPDAIARLEAGLASHATALGASHLAAPGGRGPSTALLGQALTHLPDPLLDRLLTGVDGASLPRAKAAIDTLPDPAQTKLRAAVALAQGPQLERAEARVDTARDKLATATAAGDQRAIGDSTLAFSQAVGNLKTFNEAMALPVDAAVQTALDAEVEVAHDNHVARLMVPVDAQSAELATSVAARDHGQIATKLMALGADGGPVGKLRLFEASMGRPVSAPTHAAVTASVSSALNVLRSPANPVGPLTGPTLQGLSNHEFGYVRKARAELGAFGLSFDRPAVDAELATRTAASKASYQQAATTLLRALADPQTSGAEVVRQTRVLAAHTGVTLSTLTTLGEEVGADDIGREAASVTRGAVTAFRVQQGAAADAQIGAILGRYEQHVGPLSDALPDLSGGAANQVTNDGTDADSNAAKQTIGVLTAATFLLPALRQDLEASLPVIPEERHAREVKLSSELRAAVASEFGLSVNADVSEVTPVLLPEQRAAVEAELVRTPPGEGEQTVNLPVAGGVAAFQVDTLFAKDAVTRTGISFAVSGRAPDGQRVQSDALRPGMPSAERPAALGEGLSALRQLAGDAAVPLTRYMNQQLGGGMMATLASMGPDGPVRLPSGEAVSPGGGGRLHFDIERLPDGRLSATATVAFTGLASGTVMSREGVSSASFDPEKSSFEAQFSVYVSDDGTQFTMREPLHLRHTLVASA